MCELALADLDLLADPDVLGLMVWLLVVLVLDVEPAEFLVELEELSLML